MAVNCSPTVSRIAAPTTLTAKLHLVLEALPPLVPHEREEAEVRRRGPGRAPDGAAEAGRGGDGVQLLGHPGALLEKARHVGLVAAGAMHWSQH